MTIPSERVCWDCQFRDRVALNGRQSTCRTRHVGALLTRGTRTVADGFNGNLSGHVHCYDGGCPRCAGDPTSGASLDRCWCCHAEQNLVAYCARRGVSMDGTTLWLPCTPCLDCYKLVDLAGVREIVYDEAYPASDGIVRQLAAVSGIVIRGYECTCNESAAA